MQRIADLREKAILDEKAIYAKGLDDGIKEGLEKGKQKEKLEIAKKLKKERMINELGIDMIAEGVETKEQADFLKENGCMYAQGYYYYKPMPIEEFAKLLENSAR